MSSVGSCLFFEYLCWSPQLSGGSLYFALQNLFAWLQTNTNKEQHVCKRYYVVGNGGPGRYSDRSLFRQVDIPTGRYSDRSIFRQTGRYSDRSLFRQVDIPTGRYSDRSIFRQTGRYSDRSLFRQVDCPTNRSIFRMFYIIVMRVLTTINSHSGDE